MLKGHHNTRKIGKMHHKTFGVVSMFTPIKKHVDNKLPKIAKPRWFFVLAKYMAKGHQIKANAGYINHK
jgi:hypothetical protein